MCAACVAGVPLYRRALSLYGVQLHAALMTWLVDSDPSLNPVGLIILDHEDPGAGDILSREQAIALLERSDRRAVGRILAKLPPVPAGRVDLIVSTPRQTLLAKSVPFTECMS